MTLGQLAKVMDADTNFTVLIGSDQEVALGKEDKAILEALSDVVVERAMVNTENRLCVYAKTILVRDRKEAI